LIGGLIKESDVETQNKIPWLGDLWLIGWLFQRREINRERNEIIITLLPRIVPEAPCGRTLEPIQVEQAGTPLFYGPLHRMDRRAWEPQLPDAGRPKHCEPGCPSGGEWGPPTWPAEPMVVPAPMPVTAGRPVPTSDASNGEVRQAGFLQSMAMPPLKGSFRLHPQRLPPVR
jgi:hypothetical protein